jgi:RNA polymerase subunit RPABC4/transcription elongation factor Spt4
MAPRIFHGNLTPADVARTLIAQFNRGNLRAAQYGQGNALAVQIATRDRPASGGQTALTVQIQKVTDGVAVDIGQQGFLGVAASLGQTALSTLINPWNLLGRLDDLAQDVENLQLSEKVWHTVEEAAQAAGASFELSERLRRMVCAYCNAANPVGEAVCVACGAPLGDVQPDTCKKCGYVFKAGEKFCSNCGAALR